MNAEPTGRCGGCKFWRRDEGDARDVGWCQRHAPAPLIVVGAYDSGRASERVVWPLVSVDDGCGEYRARGAPPVVTVPVPGATADERWDAFRELVYPAVAARLDEWNWPKGRGRTEVRQIVESGIIDCAVGRHTFRNPPADAAPVLERIRGCDVLAVLAERRRGWVATDTPKYKYASMMIDAYTPKREGDAA